MFCCFCPKKDKEQHLQQSLIEQEGSSFIQKTIIAMQTNDSPLKPKLLMALPSNKEHSQKPKIEDTKSDHEIGKSEQQIKIKQIQQKTQNRAHSQTIGVPPSFLKAENLKKGLTKQFQKNIVFSKKSHLWNEQLRSDLIYLNLKSGSYIYISYRLTKNQEVKGCPNALDYFLSKSQDKTHVIIGKQGMINGKLSTLSKYNLNVIVTNFGNITNLHQQDYSQIELLMVQDMRSIRWQGIDSIVVMADSLHHQQIKAQMNNILKDLSWEELKKITFLFPVYMTLEDISQILFSSMKQYVMNMTLQKASLDLAFEMELIECANLDAFIIIKSRSEDIKVINSVYDHLKTSIAMFGKQLNDETQKLYRDFYIRIRQKTLKDYFAMKQLYRRNPSQFRAKVIQVRDIDSNAFASLEMWNSLKQFPCEDSGFYYVIQNKVREDIGRIFNIAELQKKQIDTPVKSEWDDDATADDFKTIKTSKLDSVAKQELDKIDMDMGLIDDDEDQLYYKSKTNDEPDMIIKVEQTDLNYQKSNQIQIEEQSPLQRSSNSQFSRNRCDKNHRYDHFY